MKTFLNQLTNLLTALNEHGDLIILTTYLIQNPQEFWGCIENFE